MKPPSDQLKSAFTQRMAELGQPDKAMTSRQIEAFLAGKFVLLVVDRPGVNWVCLASPNGMAPEQEWS